jgi:serine/threonine protein kinase/tetratricopeptide (TPR) repeat protein
MIGQQISHYRVLARLGEGGMGAVYRAEDLVLQREVALKFLPPNVAAVPDARARLMKEAQAASRLNHPNIATIYELNVTEDAPFISMELVSGETLRDYLQRSTPGSEFVLRTARAIAEGLREAHSRGVFHHDIKPANVMLDSRSSVKILDFGLSELARQDRPAAEGEEAFLTRSAAQNGWGGTVEYMAPERILGEAGDHRSDIFSFGVLLYECLTGRPPFRGQTAIDILRAILREPYAPLRTTLPDIDRGWERLMDGCLAKSPAQRFSSMQEVLNALDGLAAPPSPSAEKSIAVLYFANLGGNKDDEYFRDGMTEDILTELTKIEDLRLLPRSAVLPLRDKTMTVSQIGHELSVAYVLDGTVRRAGTRLRVTAQLADTRTGHSLWAERYDRQLEDVFAIQDEIAQSIAGALRVMLTEKEKRAIEKIPTRDVQAYDYYLRGRRVFYELRRKSLEFARQMFARAIVIDPGYAAAFAGVANASSLIYMWFEATDDNLSEAMRASRRAVELDPESAEAHTSRGLAESIGKNYAEAEKEFEEATRLNPRLFEAFYLYARCCFAQGEMEKAAELFRKASELDPADYQSLNHREMCLRTLGRLDEAREASLEGLARAERYVELHPEDARALYLGAGAHSLLGHRERALEWANRALALDPEENTTRYNVACTYAHLGETGRALDLLEAAVRSGFGNQEWIDNDPDLASLHGEPRFAALRQLLAAKKTAQTME